VKRDRRINSLQRQAEFLVAKATDGVRRVLTSWEESSDCGGERGPMKRSKERRKDQLVAERRRFSGCKNDRRAANYTYSLEEIKFFLKESDLDKLERRKTDGSTRCRERQMIRLQ
jgi:hypothetical protein